jgi:hypothetical protein
MGNLVDNGRGFPARDMDPYLRRFEISFAPNGGGVIDATQNQGNLGLWTVARISQGLYRVTLRDSFREVNLFDASLQFNTAATVKAQPGPVVKASRTFDVFVTDAAGAVQDVAANANNRINVKLVLRCSELKA